MTDLIAPHGGYKNLKSFQATVIIYDLTVDFCKRYVPDHKMRAQLEGAARSGSQNIGEGSQNSGTSKQTELRLVDVARGSLEELLLDYQAFLRQHRLPQWAKDDPRASAIRNLAYQSNRSYMTYTSYLSNPESAANCLICLIHQANYLLDKQIAALESDYKHKGDFKERYREFKKREILGGGNEAYEALLKKFHQKRLENGMVVHDDQYDETN